MAIKHIELEIGKESPFLNCKLERQKYADVLTSIVENYPGGFVLAINNRWGTGKTTFVKMWQQDLINEGYETIYFNAWENDFEDNSLTALLGELKTLNPTDEQSLTRVIKSAAKLSKNVAPAVFKAIIDKYIDSEVVLQAISDSIKTSAEIFEKEVDEYAERKKSIYNFRKNLSQYISQKSVDKPLIFIVDELDRCRPNYSVTLLEQVKHFFSVKNIIFVLAIDKEQLGNAICGVYGTDKLDSNAYLKRFIDIEYSIPDPKPGQYFDYLYDYFDFDSYLNSAERNKIYELRNDRDIFKTVGKLLLGKLNLRELEKVLANTRMALRMLTSNNYLIPEFFTFLIYVKFYHNQFYQNLISKTYDLSAAHQMMYNVIQPLISDENQRYFVHIEGQFLTYYQNYISENRTWNEIYEYDKDLGKNKLNVNSKIDDNLLLDYFTSSSREFRASSTLKLNYFTNSIELTESIKTN